MDLKSNDWYSHKKAMWRHVHREESHTKMEIEGGLMHLQAVASVMSDSWGPYGR